MNFHSFRFIFLFLPVTLAGYFALARVRQGRWPRVWLLLASLVFFAASGLADVLLLLASLGFNGVVGGLLVRTPPPRRALRLGLLWTGIAGNLLLLCRFKYAAFFTAAANEVAGA